MVSRITEARDIMLLDTPGCDSSSIITSFRSLRSKLDSSRILFLRARDFRLVSLNTEATSPEESDKPEHSGLTRISSIWDMKTTLDSSSMEAFFFFFLSSSEDSVGGLFLLDRVILVCGGDVGGGGEESSVNGEITFSWTRAGKSSFMGTLELSFESSCFSKEGAALTFEKEG
uniref:Uncharacterized protein n=1 Tax=Cacopsylla melanoneura TaxID=428564 RepID=A0A8D9A3E7_9HEMI